MFLEFARLASDPDKSHPHKLPLPRGSGRGDRQSLTFCRDAFAVKSEAEFAVKSVRNTGLRGVYTDGAPSRIACPRELASHMEETVPWLSVPLHYSALEAVPWDQAGISDARAQVSKGYVARPWSNDSQPHGDKERGRSLSELGHQGIAKDPAMCLSRGRPALETGPVPLPREHASASGRHVLGSPRWNGPHRGGNTLSPLCRHWVLAAAAALQGLRLGVTARALVCLGVSVNRKVRTTWGPAAPTGGLSCQRPSPARPARESCVPHTPPRPCPPLTQGPAGLRGASSGRRALLG